METLNALISQKKNYATAMSHRESKPLVRMLAKEDGEERESL